MTKAAKITPERRFYVCGTEQEIYSAGADYATSVEFDPFENKFNIHAFTRRSTEWIVNESETTNCNFSETFKKKFPALRIVEMFDKDVARNEEWAVHVTIDCTRRINTPDMQAVSSQILLNIGYGKLISSNN